MRPLLIILLSVITISVTAQQRYRVIEVIDSNYSFYSKEYYPRFAKEYCYQKGSNRGSTYKLDTISYNTMWDYSYRENERGLYRKYIRTYDSTSRLFRELSLEVDKYGGRMNPDDYTFYRYDSIGRIVAKLYYHDYDFIPFDSQHDMRSFAKGIALERVWPTGRDSFIYIGDDIVAEYNYRWCDRSTRKINDSLVYDSLCLNDQKWYQYDSIGHIIAKHRRYIGKGNVKYPMEVIYTRYNGDGEVVSSSEWWYYLDKTILIDTLSISYTDTVVLTDHKRYNYYPNYQDYINKSAPFYDTLIERKIAIKDSLGRIGELRHWKYKSPTTQPRWEKTLYEYNKDGEEIKVAKYYYPTLESQTYNFYQIRKMRYENGCLIELIFDKGGENTRRRKTKTTYTYEVY